MAAVNETFVDDLGGKMTNHSECNSQEKLGENTTFCIVLEIII